MPSATNMGNAKDAGFDLRTHRPEQRPTVRMGMAIAEVERRRIAAKARGER